MYRDVTARDVRDERPRFGPTPEAESRLIGAFAGAMISGDVQALASILAEDAILYTDGGGKRLAALKPVFGRDKILRFFEDVKPKNTLPTPENIRPARINGLPGFVLRGATGVETVAIETSGEQIVALYFVRNPDKLRHLA